MAHAYPALREVRWVDHEVKRSRPSWSTRWNPVSTKNTKISWAWWCAPVVPATREPEAGELLEPRRQRLQWAEIAPLLSSLDDRARLCLKKNKKWEMFEVIAQLPWFDSYTLHAWIRISHLCHKYVPLLCIQKIKNKKILSTFPKHIAAHLSTAFI